MIKISKHARHTLCALALLARLAVAQSDGAEQATQASPSQQPAQPATTPPPVTTAGQDNTPSSDASVNTPRYSFGFRVEYFPERFFQTQYVVVNTTNPLSTIGNYGTSAGSKLELGLTGEFRLNDRISLGLDYFRHQVSYAQTSLIKSGLPDPNSSYDNRPLTTVMVNTQVDYSDFPLVARYYTPQFKKIWPGLRWVSQTYALGGGTFRHVSNIRTGTSTSFPDTTTSYNEIPVAPIHNNLIGAVGGLGYRLFEYGKFRSLFEVRYTRWFEESFAGAAYKSNKNQVELGLSFTY